MIGFYNYTVILTYLSLCSSVVGIFFTLNCCFGRAIACLALSGLLDAFDGKVARTKANRTEDEKRFGIQIDSLCDMVCFGVFPVIFCYFSGMTGPISCLILIFYTLAGLIRLAYYNVLEETRQQETDQNRKYYNGLPITTISVILPLFYVSSSIFGAHFLPALNVVMLITGLLFVINFHVRKPTNLELGIIIFIVGCAVVYLLIHFNWADFLKHHFAQILQFLRKH